LVQLERADAEWRGPSFSSAYDGCGLNDRLDRAKPSPVIQLVPVHRSAA
jgi:hypothetical protein